ncbi:hypothetical protein TrRE_jg1039 [Triparma retinervis]|uniref:Uncharacterized protein n=1 Tax=Triparma retinervis TaxID=2557542 RepID=A0A9W7E2J1_9STRA|nr:hypothetical protein TrRE_jg1039 [Triparma retinervis]
MSSERPQVGLRGCVQNRILNDVFDSCAASTPGWLVLIVDDAAMRVVSSVVGMYDIMEKKITTVESINNTRQPLPEMEVRGGKMERDERGGTNERRGLKRRSRVHNGGAQ